MASITNMISIKLKTWLYTNRDKNAYNIKEKTPKTRILPSCLANFFNQLRKRLLQSAGTGQLLNITFVNIYDNLQCRDLEFYSSLCVYQLLFTISPTQIKLLAIGLRHVPYCAYPSV